LGLTYTLGPGSTQAQTHLETLSKCITTTQIYITMGKSTPRQHPKLTKTKKKDFHEHYGGCMMFQSIKSKQY